MFVKKELKVCAISVGSVIFSGWESTFRLSILYWGLFLFIKLLKVLRITATIDFRMMADYIFDTNPSKKAKENAW